jgi:threonyl-tRNA synthetase
MVHRAICGSLERFLGILIESHAGHMPLWFAPLQVVVATITSEADDYGATVAQKLRDAGLQVETDFRNEKINYKVREHSLAKVPVILVCGMREAEEQTVNIRRLGSRDQASMTLADAIAQLAEKPRHQTFCARRRRRLRARPDPFPARQAEPCRAGCHMAFMETWHSE